MAGKELGERGIGGCFPTASTTSFIHSIQILGECVKDPSNPPSPRLGSQPFVRESRISNVRRLTVSRTDGGVVTPTSFTGRLIGDALIQGD